MNRPVIASDMGRLFTIGLLLIVILKLCTGCATEPNPVLHYRIEEPFDIYVGDKEWVRQQYLLSGGLKHRLSNGFYNETTRTIYVRYDIYRDDYMPNMTDLGHEITHLPEVRGRWHE